MDRRNPARLRAIQLAFAALGLASCATVAEKAAAPHSGARRAWIPVREAGIGESAQEPSGAAQQEGQDPAAPAAGAETARSPEAQAETGIPIHGYAQARYRYRATPDENDHDLEGTLLLDIGDPERHPVTGHLQAWSNFDLDETAGSGGPDPFFDLTDTYANDLTARLYQAYVDVHTVEELELLRVGRQPLYDTPEIVSFDGARLETGEHGSLAVRAGAYAGIPVHTYESSPAGDRVLGTFLETRPWRGGWTRLDWMHLEDEDVLADHRNDLFALGAWQRFGTHFRLEGNLSWLEQESRDVRAAATWSDPGHDLTVQVSWYQLLNTQKDLATEVDPFFEALLEHFPFYRAQVLISKGFAERYRVEAGSELRRLEDEDDEGEFNRDYERYHARFALDDLVLPDLVLGLAGEVWNDGDGNIRTWEADLSREWGPWRASGGSYYALYDLDLFTLDEKDDVRVWFLELRYDWTKNTRLELSYEFENDDLDQYQVLRTGVLWRF